MSVSVMVMEMVITDDVTCSDIALMMEAGSTSETTVNF
jgi:hypothetical protein